MTAFCLGLLLATFGFLLLAWWHLLVQPARSARCTDEAICAMALYPTSRRDLTVTAADPTTEKGATR